MTGLDISLSNLKDNNILSTHIRCAGIISFVHVLCPGVHNEVKIVTKSQGCQEVDESKGALLTDGLTSMVSLMLCFNF